MAEKTWIDYDKPADYSNADFGREKRKRQPSRISSVARYGGLGSIAWLLAQLGRMGCLVMMLLAVLVPTAIVLKNGKSPLDVLSFIWNHTDGTVVTADRSPIIIGQLHAQAILETASLPVSNLGVEVYVSPWCLVSHACDYWIRYSFKGTVKAGIDLNLVKPGDVKRDSSGHYVVKLAQPNLTGCYITETKDQAGGGLGAANMDRNLTLGIATYHVKTDWADQVIREGLLQAAKDKAQDAVQTLVGDDVTVTWSDPTQTSLDESCTPSTPNNYTYNSSANEWDSK